MLYRTPLDNENIDAQDPQYIPNVNETNSMQQSQMWSQYMPFMDYPMMDENSPSTYGYQMPQQQYQTTQETNQNMERAPYNHNSYHDGYNHGYDHDYNHGYYNQGYHHYNNYYPNYNAYANYNPYFNPYFNPYYNYFPIIPIIPSLFNRY